MSSARSRTRWVWVIWLRIFYALTARWWIFQSELDAAHHVLDVDEGAGLASGSMYRQRIADAGLHEEAVQNRSVVAVILKAVN